MIFAARNNEKKIFIKKKQKKKYVVQIWNGLLPNCIFREWELYCNTEICIVVRNLGGAENCIARGSCVLQYSGVQGFKTVLQYSLLGSSVLQYTALYCGWKGCRRPGCIAIQPGVSWHETGLPVLQDRQSCHDTAGWALGRAGLGAGAPRLGRWGEQAWVLGRAGRQASGRERACGRERARGRGRTRRRKARRGAERRRQRARQAQQAQQEQAGRRRGRAGRGALGARRAGRATWACLCAQAGRAG